MLRPCLRLAVALAVLPATACMHAGGMARQPSYVAQNNPLLNGGAGAGTTNLNLAPAVVFQDGVGSVSYHAPTFADLPAHTEVRDVKGRACESGLQIPWGLLTQPTSYLLDGLNASVGWGDSGYARALRDAANQVGPDALLYDVRVDLQTINVLSIWRQSCLLVTASAVTRLPDEDEGGATATGAAPADEVSAKPAAQVATPATAVAPADAAIAPTQDPASAPRGGADMRPTATGQDATKARGPAVLPRK